MLCPIRYYINRGINRSEVNADEKTKYKDVALNFPSDYDKENPLTKSKGIERLHNLHYSKLKADGKEDEAENLKAAWAGYR